jgi:SAM-dependent methyltransferase
VSATKMHRRVLDVLRQQPPGRVLDIPSGRGPVCDGARTMGHDVVQLDLFRQPNFRGVIADACARLPFVDASFDTVVSMEGIEHFENQTGFVRECARVLRPGGLLILTTPNLLHLSSRISGFFTAQRLMRQGFINEETTLAVREPTRLYHGHAYLIDAFRLRYILRVGGLRLQQLYTTNLSFGSLLLAPLVPMIWWATRYTLWSGRRHRRRRHKSVTSPTVERDIARLALSPALLLSRGLVAVAYKEDAAA